MSKKEAWKKQLGISEYPWSSDDDDDDSSSKSSPQRSERPESRPRLNGTSDPVLSGPSRNATPPTNSQILSTTAKNALPRKHEDYYWYAMPKLSTSKQVANASSTSRKAPPSAPPSSSSAAQKAQNKKDRDSFWSAINRPNRFAAMATLPKNRDNLSRSLTHPTPSRNTSFHPSLPRSSLPTPLTPLSRSLQPVHTSLSTSAIPGTSADRHTDLQKLFETRNVMLNRYLEATKKSTANLVSVSRILLKAKRRSRDSRAPSRSTSAPHTEDRSRLYTAPGTGGETPRGAPQAAPAEIPAASVGIEHSDEATDATNAPAVALEEEIVEIETEADNSLETEAETSLEVAEPSGDGGTAQVTNQAGETNEGTSQPHGVKRKRNSDDDDEHSSVREINQGLLKLLECPVCLECMAPPLAQCRRGHLVCGRCRARLAACPVCRAGFSSVRNRAMEGVADMVRYPCRHGCGREVRLRRRGAHEACCAARRHRCPAPACAARPMTRHELPAHAESKHLSIMKLGKQHDLSLQLNAEEKKNFLVLVYGEVFHLKLDVDVRTWGLMLYVTYMGPFNEASKYTYQVVVTGQYNSRKLVYSRETHCDLESSALNISRQDCFHMTLDQAINFLRVRNKPCEPNQTLNLSVEILQNETQHHDGVKISD